MASALPLHGIRLSFLDQFLDLCNGREKLEGLSTEDVCREIVKPTTKQLQSSYCDWLKSENHPGFAEIATVFISHAWKFKFLDVVDALYEHFGDDQGKRDQTVIWFDVFSVNQHDLSKKDFNWWDKIFKSAIKQFGRTVMVLAPWNDPLPLRRAWCIFELYCTAATKSRFEVAMNRFNKNLFLESIRKEGIVEINKMLAVVDAERSECDKEEDRNRIFEVANIVGFKKLNAMVFEQLRGWVISVVLEEIDKETNQEKIFELKHQLANLYSSQAKYDLAEPLYLECLAGFKSLTIVHPFMIKTINNNLGFLYQCQGDYDKAETFLLKSLHLKELLGNLNPVFLEPMGNLALVYYQQGKFDQAQPLYDDCVMISRTSYGEDHEKTLTLIDNLASVYHSMGNFDQAERLFRDSYEKRKEKLGENHPDTLISINNLANLYSNQGKFDRAEPLLVENMNRMISCFGDSHPDSLSSIYNLAQHYRERGRFDEAEQLLIKCLERNRRNLGENHPDTLRSMDSLGILYDAQSRYQEAEKLFEICVKGRKQVLGEMHPLTADSINNLATVYQGKV